jgi:hypothetical protein
MRSFLDAAACRVEIKRMIEDGKAVRAAVAYWGEGAVKELGIHAGSDLTVVCDVRGGGSNPAEVKKLIEILGEQRVLTHDRLHAKTWEDGDRAIVGSSNASSNGLGKEGQEVASLLEANLLVDDQTLLTALNTWFTDVVLPSARIVTDDDLKVGAKRHRQRREGRPIPDRGDLLSLLIKEPESFADRDIYVWVWDPASPNRWVKSEMESIQADRDDDTIDFYQDADAPAGAYILEFETVRGQFVGLYQVLKDRHIHRTDKGNLLLCREKKSIEGLRVGDLKKWSIAAKRAATSGLDEWQIVDFAKKFII